MVKSILGNQMISIGDEKNIVLQVDTLQVGFLLTQLFISMAKEISR